MHGVVSIYLVLQLAQKIKSCIVRIQVKKKYPLIEEKLKVLLYKHLPTPHFNYHS